MELISLQLMDSNYQPIQASTYTAPRSVEQLQDYKEIIRLVDVGVIEEDYSSEFLIPNI
jgi:hypothetical protein